MNDIPHKALIFACAVACVAPPAVAADRVRAGKWETTMKLGEQSVTRSTCMSQADADAINGDAKSIRARAERVNAPTGCEVMDVRINGNQVNVTSVCASGKESVGTTTYHRRQIGDGEHERREVSIEVGRRVQVS